MSSPLDVLVLGAGPAALSLAGALGAHGLKTACMAPDPHLRWAQVFGAWEDEIRGTVAERCVQARWERPLVATPVQGPRGLDRVYTKLHTPGLQEGLEAGCAASGVRLLRGRAMEILHQRTGTLVKLDQGELQAALVVDATGGGSRLLQREGGQAPGFQTAWGQLVRVAGHPWQAGEMALMDWRPAGEPGDPVPSFLYALPLGPDLVFVEETVLVRRPAFSHRALAGRLEARLRRLGIERLEVLEEERCTIAMGGPMPVVGQRTLGFGAAAGLVHPATGYQLARSLQMAGPLADVIREGLAGGQDPAQVARSGWGLLWPEDRLRAWELLRFGMDALCQLDADRTARFFDAFFALPADWQDGFLSARLGPPAVARVMAGLFARADPDIRRSLAGLGLRSSGSLLRAVLS